jgi:hypothetical protein
MKFKKEKKKKLPKGLTEEFIEMTQSASTDELKAQIVTMQVELSNCEKFLKEKPEILDLREQLAMVEGPTKETKTSLKNRTKHVLTLLGERGAL